jgi:hypothetical protein
MNKFRCLAYGIIFFGLVGCQSQLVKPSSNTQTTTNTAETQNLSLIERTKEEVKAGAAVMDKLFIHRKAKSLNNQFLEQYANNFAGVFKSFDDYIAFFTKECDLKGGVYQNYMCWSEDKQEIHFVAELYITEYRSTFNRIYLNMISPKESVSMINFVDALAPLVEDIPVIKFKPREISRFELIQRLDSSYDDISEQITVLKGFESVSKSERLAAAKTIHDSVISSRLTKELQVWHTADEVFGSVKLLSKYEIGNQICADVKIFRKVGIKPSFKREMSNILKGEDGEDTNKNTLCTSTTDTNNLSWRFVS